MSIEKPYLGLSRNRLTNLINEDNGRGRVEGVDFTYGLPRETTGPNGENTVVTLTPVPGTRYIGPVDVYYTRLPISVVGELPYNSIEPVVIPTAPFWTWDVLSEINRALGLNLTPDEVVNQQHTQLQSSYELTINGAVSLAWIPSTLQFQAVQSPLLRMDELITAVRFFGFTFTPSQLGHVLSDEPLDGFNAAISDLNIVLPSFLDGFDPKWRDLAEDINASALDGFEFSPGDLSTAIGSPLIGFDESDGDLSANIEDVLDGFTTSTGEINFIIAGFLDGFDLTPNTLENLIKVDSLDGFDRSEGSLTTSIFDSFDGFDQTDGSLVTSVFEFLDGFDQTEGSLTTSIFDSLDGFERETTLINTIFTLEFFDGFDYTPGDLNDLIDIDSFDGFIVGDTPVGEIIIGESFDGFEPEQTALVELINTDSFDGFVLTPGPLDVIVTDILDGFIDTDGQIETLIINSLDGFDLTPGEITQLITDEFFDGFDAEVTPLDDVVFNDTPDGFDLTPAQLDSIVTADTFDGFIVADTPIVEILTQSSVDGFDAEQTALNELLVQDFVDGFDQSPGTLSNLIVQEFFDGFFVPDTPIEEIIRNDIDGFDLTPGQIDTLVSMDVMDGFNPEFTALIELIFSDTFDGFDPAISDVSDVIYSQAFDGFDYTPGIMNDLIGQVDGFVISPGDLATSIDDQLDGFEMKIDPLDEVITQDFLDGFVRNESHLSVFFDDPYSDGFVYTPGNIVERIYTDKLDGFAQYISQLSDGIRVENLDGFIVGDTPISEIIYSTALDGFNPVDTSLALHFNTEFLDGFIFPDTAFNAVMVSDTFDGFDPAPNDLDNTINDVLDGFVYTPSNLSTIINSDALDGFIREVGDLDATISEGTLDGFDLTPAQLDDIIIALTMDGFVRGETDLEDIQIITPDGFDPAPNEIASHIRTVSFKGFEPAPGPLEGHITVAYLDGFESSPYQLYEVLRKPIDGFVWSDGFLESINSFVDGFEPDTTVPELPVDEALDGFDPEPEWRVELDSVISDLDGYAQAPGNLEDAFDIGVDGFDPVPEWRSFLVDVVDEILNGALNQSDSFSIDGMSVQLGNGFVSYPELTFVEVINETQTGFDPVPEWRKSLIDYVSEVISLDKNDAYLLSENISGNLSGLEPPQQAPWDGVVNEFMNGFIGEIDDRLDIGSVVLQVFEDTFTQADELILSENISGRIPDALAQHSATNDISEMILSELPGFISEVETRTSLLNVVTEYLGGALTRNDAVQLDTLMSNQLSGWDKQADYSDLEEIIIAPVYGFDAPDTRQSLTDVVSVVLNNAINKNNWYTFPMNVTGPLDGITTTTTKTDLSLLISSRLPALTLASAATFSEQLTGPVSGLGLPDAATFSELIDEFLNGFTAS